MNGRCGAAIQAVCKLHLDCLLGLWQAVYLVVNLESVYRPIIVVGIAHVDELSTPIGSEIKMNIYLGRLRPWGQGGRIRSKLIGGEVHHICSVLSSSLSGQWFMIEWMGHGVLLISETPSFSTLYGTGPQIQWAIESTGQSSSIWAGPIHSINYQADRLGGSKKVSWKFFLFV